MLSVDHSNTDGPPLAVQCVRKFVSALGREVTSVCVCLCVCVCVCVCVRVRARARRGRMECCDMEESNTNAYN